nr:helix-turn-helix domain-containing protein [Pseudovibrio flavus]
MLDSAERLLTEHGMAATSVRMITEEAGANVASVNYHFGSKEDLIRAVLERRMADIDDMRMQRLDALEVGGRKPSVDEIVRACIEPLIVQGVSRETSEMVPFVLLLRQLMADPDMGQKILHNWEPPLVLQRVGRALSAATGTRELRPLELKLMAMLMHSSAIEILHAITGKPSSAYEAAPDRDEIVERGMRFAISGIEAYLIEPALEDA